MLMLAGVFLVMAVIDKPSLLLFFASAERLVSMVLIIVAAFVATLGIYRLADAIFGRNNTPWHGKASGSILLIAALIGINFILMTLDNMLSNIFGTGPFSIPRAYLYLFTTFELLWILLLDWIR